MIVGIRAHYAAELERLGLTSAEALTAYYDKVRLTILAAFFARRHRATGRAIRVF